MPATVTASSTTEVVALLGEQDHGKVLAEYVWTCGAELKSRTVVLDAAPGTAGDCPIAAIDGSTYGQAAPEACELYLHPRTLFADPFRGGEHILVLCEIFVPPLVCAPGLEAWEASVPHASNHRAACEAVMAAAAHQAPVLSMQQEYSLAAPAAAAPPPPATCGLGAVPIAAKSLPPGLSDKALARLGCDVHELHAQACLAAGLAYSGGAAAASAHACAAPSSFAYAIGPCRGIEAADQLAVSRFLLGRIAGAAGAAVDWDGTAQPRGGARHRCVLQLSTASSRDALCGLSEAQAMLERLAAADAAGYGGCSAPGLACASWHSASAFSEGSGEAPGSPSAHSAASCGSSHTGPAGRAALGGCVGGAAGGVSIPTSTLLARAGPILDTRSPGSADPHLATMLLVCGACGTPLPPATLCALQMAAVLQAQLLGGTFCIAPSAKAGSAAASLSSAAPASLAGSGMLAGSDNGGHRSRHSSGSAGSDSLGGAAKRLDSLGGAAERLDSHELLLSALDRMDGHSHGSAAWASSFQPCASGARVGSKRRSDTASDATSPMAASPPARLADGRLPCRW